LFYQPGWVTEALPDRQRIDLARLSVPALVHTKIARLWLGLGNQAAFSRLPVRSATSVARTGVEAPGRLDQVGVPQSDGELSAKSIVWRKDKQGFTIPQAEWLKHELRQRMENLMDGEMLSAKLGLVDRQALPAAFSAVL